MQARGRKTSYRGVWRLDHDRYLVRAQWKDPKTGRVREVERTVTAASPAEADELRRRLRAEAEGTRGAERMRVRDYATSWLRGKAPGLTKATGQLYATIVGSHVLPVLGDYYVDAVTRVDVLRWRDAQQGAPATINGRLRVLRTLFRDAVVDLGLPSDPTFRVSGIGEVRAEDDHKTLTADELRAVVDAVRANDPQWYTLVLALATTGARFGEATALRWEDIDEAAGVIRIRRSQWHGHVGATKTKRTRTVPLVPELAEALRAHRRAQLEGQVTGLASGFVFLSAVGTLLQPSSIRKPLARAAKATGIERKPTSHWFRHTLNNLLRQATSGEVTRSITGHVTAEMTEHYSHVAASEKRAAVVRVLGPVAAKTGDGTGGPYALN